jgi:hypothetical protein
MHVSVAPRLYFPASHETQEFVVLSALFPASQSVHVLWPSLLFTKPAAQAQSVQLLAALLEYLPTAQLKHTLADASLYFPASHSLHADSPSSEKRPGVQSVQVEAPIPLNFPAKQVPHEVAANPGLYLPESQREQTLSSAFIEKRPVMQSEHTEDPAPENFPATQLAQDDAAVDEYVPAMQLVHDEDSAVLYFPATQPAHDVPPIDAEYLPPGHF